MAHEWLSEALQNLPLTEEVEAYLLARGVREETIRDEGLKTWQLLSTPSPDPTFIEMTGPKGLGERLDGMLIIPVRSPRGQLIGFEARDIHKKRILDYRLPPAKWLPFFIGTRTAMPSIWAGGDVWLVEGFFDKAPLEWVVPPKDSVLACVRAHLTPQQLEFLRRFCRGTVRVAFDRDVTGRKAVSGWVDEKTGKWRRGAVELLRGIGAGPERVDPARERCLGCMEKDSGSGNRCRGCGMARLDACDVTYSGGKDPGEIWDKGGVPAMKAAFT